jgi:hypothetical protein
MIIKSKFIPPMGWENSWKKRKEISAAYAAWLADIDVDWWVTLNFNHRPITLPGVRWKFRAWLARIDREFLGHDWCKRGGARAFAIAVVEHFQTNTHLHVLLRMPAPARALRRPYQSEPMQRHWRKLMPGGQWDGDLIYAREGVVRYMCKELAFSEHLEGGIMISTEFHNDY